MNATLTYRAQMVAVISLLCNDTKAGGSTVTSNFGSTVIVQNKHSEKKTYTKNKQAKVPVMCAGEQKNYVTCTIANQH